MEFSGRMVAVAILLTLLIGLVTAKPVPSGGVLPKKKKPGRPGKNPPSKGVPNRVESNFGAGCTLISFRPRSNRLCNGNRCFIYCQLQAANMVEYYLVYNGCKNDRSRCECVICPTPKSSSLPKVFYPNPVQSAGGHGMGHTGDEPGGHGLDHSEHHMGHSPDDL